MNVKILFNKIEYNINLSNFYDISIPLKFNGKQPNFYDVNKAKAQPLITGNTVWAVKDKASCIISARRTYADVLLNALEPNNSNTNGGYYFYDLKF